MQKYDKHAHAVDNHATSKTRKEQQGVKKLTSNYNDPTQSAT